ncbi:CSC1-like protein [Populus alba x Populus x berolinensis]|nr:CSC1-like protein [Populus alba x Populus x berolinensis]
MLSSSGLDAVVYMRTITFCLKVFSFAGIIGVFILLPVNCSGTELHQIDFEDLYSNSLDVFTISNVNRGSKWLWIHFSSVYAITIFICYLLYHEYNYISSKRIAYFYSSKPQPHHFTILVRNIPVSAGSSVSDSVEGFFTEYYPTTYLSHIVVRRTSKVQSLIVDRLDHYGKRLEDLEQNARLEQSEDTHAAFVSFKTRYGASTVFHQQQSTNPTHWLTEEAPQPNDVFWPFFSSSFMGRWISKLLVVVACILLTILFLIPVVVVQGLTNLSQLEVWFSIPQKHSNHVSK